MYLILTWARVEGYQGGGGYLREESSINGEIFNMVIQNSLRKHMKLTGRYFSAGSVGMESLKEEIFKSVFGDGHLC